MDDIEFHASIPLTEEDLKLALEAQVKLKALLHDYLDHRISSHSNRVAHVQAMIEKFPQMMAELGWNIQDGEPDR